MTLAFDKQMGDVGPALGKLALADAKKRKGEVRLPMPRTVPINQWPPDYDAALRWRRQQLALMTDDPNLVGSALRHYSTNPVEFINHWCNTYDPRNKMIGKPVWFPMIMFPKQAELVDFTLACMRGEGNGIVEKSRDMGATWVEVGLSVWMWLFLDQIAVGWGSRKQDLVDRLGDPSSIFEKIRMVIRALPEQFLPEGFDAARDLTYMRAINRQTGSTMIGEIGDDIGRGGRTAVYFVDEAAHLAHPESVEASLLANTRTRIDISSVSGLGTVFERKRNSGKEWHAGQEIDKSQENVFVMDWSSHPLKTVDWHDSEKKRLVGQGLGHVFAREVDRDYAAAVEGIIIPAEYVKAAVDAHKKLKLPEPTGPVIGGLDVADGGMDKNALAVRRSYLMQHTSVWSAEDPGISARKAVAIMGHLTPVGTNMELEYDAIGVGAGVKTETNRLRKENLLPPKMRVIPWFAGSHVLHPFERIVKGDSQSPMNRDFFHNLKAQAWWELRLRFERTWKMINDPVAYQFDPDDLISLPSDLPLIDTLINELSQPVMGYTSSMKLVIDKAPEGTKSPNLGDATVMAYWPLPPIQHTVALGGFTVLRQNRDPE